MNVLFPHSEVREIQDLFMDDIIEALKNNKHLLAHVPTGIGKTAAVLSTTIPYALENNKTVFFLTSKHTQHKIAMETIEKIKKKHKVDFKVANFIGKRWMCLQPGVTELRSGEFADFCSTLIEKKQCEYFTNLKKGAKLSINSKMALDEIDKENVEEVIKVSRKNKVCPYEINCLLAQKAKVIIADYYHVLNPSIRKSLFRKISKDLSNSIIIFDEAHNLPNRIRNLLTVSLSNYTLDGAVKEAKYYNEGIANCLSKIDEVLEGLARKVKIDEIESLINKEEFFKEVDKISKYSELIDSFYFIAKQVLENKKRSYCNSVAHFLEAWLGMDEGFTRILTKEVRKKPYINLSYKCLDPSIIMKEVTQDAIVIGMSGTLNPLEMYRDLLGIEAELKEYKNPFPKKNRLNLIIPETTTKFTKRNLKMYENIAKVCASVVNLIPGNSAIFFPSYNIIDDVYSYFQSLCNKTIFIEKKGLSKEEREEFIERFKKYKDSGAVLLGCSSGSFGEGIDLPGDFLKAVIIAGLPLSKPNLETKELIKYYDIRFNRGWDYGYLYPAILKTLQNAGRCIRSKDDRGVVVFLDERYVWDNYFKCFPKEMDIKVTKLYEKWVREFFNK